MIDIRKIAHNSSLVELCDNLGARMKAHMGGFTNHQNKTIFLTMSPNPNTLHTVTKLDYRFRKKTGRIKYNMLPYHQQYDYCMRVLRSILPFEDPSLLVIGGWELNKDGNIHLHCLMFSVDFQNDTDMMFFRRSIYNNDYVIHNLPKVKGNKKPTDWMNNVVYTNDSIEDRINYIFKDYDSNYKRLDYYSITS